MVIVECFDYVVMFYAKIFFFRVSVEAQPLLSGYISNENSKYQFFVEVNIICEEKRKRKKNSFENISVCVSTNGYTGSLEANKSTAKFSVMLL